MRKSVKHTMISFERFEAAEGLPIYQQIVLYLKRGIAAGTVTAGDELPSRRVLSVMLSVNPNTVQKAYRLLEEEGLVQSHSGARSYMVLSEEMRQNIRTQLLEAEARSVIAAMKGSGLGKDEAMALLEKFWDREGEE